MEHFKKTDIIDVVEVYRLEVTDAIIASVDEQTNLGSKDVLTRDEASRWLATLKKIFDSKGK